MNYHSCKILIFDKSDFLPKLVKHYCGNNIDILFYNKKKIIETKILKQVEVAYIKSNHMDDLKEILLIHEYVDQLFIDTNSTKIKSVTKNLEKISFFSIERDRYTILTQIFNSANELK